MFFSLSEPSSLALGFYKMEYEVLNYADIFSFLV